jgi:LysM repeat protein
MAIRPPAPILPPLASPFERTASSAPVSDTKVYIVQPNDSVSKIAARYGLSVREVIEINKMKNANALRVGQKLILPAYADVKPATAAEKVAPSPKPAVRPKPAPKADAPAPAPAVEAAPAPAASGDVYEVKNGDILSRIAIKLGVKTADLKAVNNLTSDKIRVGQKLKVPGKTAAVPAPAPAPAVPAPAPAVVPAPAPAAIPPPEPDPAPKPAPAPAPAPAPESAPAMLESIGLTPPPPPPAAPAPAPSPATPAVGGGKPFPYPVGEGETIQSIASAFLVSPEALMKLNNITDPNSLKPGQKILIPMPAD